MFQFFKIAYNKKIQKIIWIHFMHITKNFFLISMNKKIYK